MSFLKIRVKRLYPLLFTLFLFILLFLVGRNYPEENIRSLIKSAGPLAPVIFILLMLLTYILAPISGSPLLFAGFYAFGEKVVFLTVVAAFIASVVNFWVARRFGRPLVEKLVGKDSIHKIDKLTANYGLVTLAVFRFFQGGIHDFVSYAAGLTSMRFSSYFLVSTIIMIPGTSLWYLLASQVGTPAEFTILSFLQATVLSTIFILGSLAIRRWKKRGR